MDNKNIATLPYLETIPISEANSAFLLNTRT